MTTPIPREKKIYVLSPDIKWKTFKLLQDKLVTKDGGPTPQNFDRILWEMLRSKWIYCWFDPKLPGDMKMGPELPKGKVYSYLSTP